MSKEKLTLDQVLSLDLPNIIFFAAPIMIGLVVLEWYLSYKEKKDFYDGKDTVAATVIGLVNVAMSAGLKVVTFGVILFFYNLVPWSFPNTWWAYVLCLLWLDFWRYWAHRIAHENRFWWATHVTHHNSEKYNWSVSFRLSWTQHIKIIFFIPVALAGFHPVMFFIVHQIAVLYQFWIHTEYIDKLPRPIEYIFTTPSHHRVHHASNEKYLDKNYGSTFIIWDRLFGTFMPEEERPAYGLTKQVNSYNPVTLNFHEWVDIFKDVKNSNSLKEAYAMVFTRPSELQEVKAKFKEKERIKV
ncbi:sterol desaturase family protein [Cecembia calidifontis]|jgi:sterol desaturase/sphingolipid hydroxylase (fatty acid hydroxylase superfamily)|uniref:Sterol desaturase/sphingolipid hydroxylase (Fatty acid hydroxylase superfamily) n=1 Tax=Cecembia calidifontis TaxID=1187080 RepID=A0A4Q7P9R6_9BACT|nr:sterol desaturase family protein [Cecembia calidifontis]RZS95482.1 sterol desaturase/sphingolipid hydroxylase (fatty acid hydroxylase superfamily) [Cecembia calidifontis]